MSINIAAVNIDNIVTAASCSSSSFSCSLQEPAQHIICLHLTPSRLSFPLSCQPSACSPSTRPLTFSVGFLFSALPNFMKQSSGASFLVIVILVKVRLIQELNASIKNQPYEGFSWDTCLFILMQRILRRICICSRAHTVFELYPAIFHYTVD